MRRIAFLIYTSSTWSRRPDTSPTTNRPNRVAIGNSSVSINRLRLPCRLPGRAATASGVIGISGCECVIDHAAIGHRFVYRTIFGRNFFVWVCVCVSRRARACVRACVCLLVLIYARLLVRHVRTARRGEARRAEDQPPRSPASACDAVFPHALIRYRGEVWRSAANTSVR